VYSVEVVNFPAPSLPPACANCVETIQYAVPGAPPLQIPSQQFRSLEGKLRLDTGTTSLITDPATGERILLDHLALEARILTPAVQIPGTPAAPAIPSLPPAALAAIAGAAAAMGAAKSQNLGKAIMEGLEVVGMRYVFQPPNVLSSWEVWTSTKLQLPVMTQTIGTFGSRLCICKCTPMQPPATLFQIPPGYRVV
jgi:hypothetical protein